MPKKDKPPAERLALHIDTAYGPIEVRENKTTRSLYFGEKKAVQSSVSLVTPDALIPVPRKNSSDTIFYQNYQ